MASPFGLRRVEREGGPWMLKQVQHDEAKGIRL
jgi:hypothetical protein